jgi:hypothetical protein
MGIPYIVLAKRTRNCGTPKVMKFYMEFWEQDV